MTDIMKRHKLTALIGLIYLSMLLLDRVMLVDAFGNSLYYLMEMIQIMPVIFMLTVSLEVLVPKEWIVKRLGNRSGIMGLLLALAFGSLSAGPIYAAFPIVKTLHKKGASISNVVVILSAWAVIKVPMLANEAKFLGPEFMLVRWVLTVIFIMIMAVGMQKMGIKIQGDKDRGQDGIHIKEAYCIGCSLCAKTLPEVFEMKSGKALVMDQTIDIASLEEEQKDRLLTAVEKCPVKAIGI